MPHKKIIYECKYCRKNFSEYSECELHEKSHIQSYKDADTKEIADKLREIKDRVYGYNIGSMVLGVPAETFESLLAEAADRLEFKEQKKRTCI